jgi:protein phosphatase
MTLLLRYAARSDVGLLRDINQDSVYAGPRLLAVADGMGGHAAGDVASRVVIATLAPLDEDLPGDDLIGALRTATRHANGLLRDIVQGDPALDGMGTTLTAMLFTGSRLGMVHVGDSRAYLYREGELAQITHDDTFVQSLVDEGRISADEASSHPQRHVITRVLTGNDVEPDYSIREAVAGDRYLLCSDGLSGVVSEDTLTEALALAEPDKAADRLVELALRSGGPDNVTVIVADVVNATSGSYGEDAPVVAGAVAEGSVFQRDQQKPSGDSAAGRAALARPPRPEPPPTSAGEAEIAERSHRVLWWTLACVVVVLLLATGGWLGWRYVQSQYYVGATDDGTVSVFRGVRGSVAGLSLHSVQHRTSLEVDDLQPFARGQVHTGIAAASRTDADHIVARLRNQQLPLCPVPTSTKSQGVPSTAARNNATARRTPTPAPTKHPATSKAAKTPKPTASASPSPSPTPSSVPLKPGVDCRRPHP